MPIYLADANTAFLAHLPWARSGLGLGLLALALILDKVSDRYNSELADIFALFAGIGGLYEFITALTAL